MIIDDIAAAVKLTKGLVNTTIATTLGLFSVATVVAFLISFGAITVGLFLGLDSIFSFFVFSFDFDYSSDWYDLVSYVLNFSFVKKLLSFVYYTSLSFSCACAGFYISVVVLSIIPTIVKWWHSFVNFITGD